MIYGFDDNKNRVEVPEPQEIDVTGYIKFTHFNYDINPLLNSSTEILTLTAGQAIITSSITYMKYSTNPNEEIFRRTLKVNPGNYFVFKMPSNNFIDKQAIADEISDPNAILNLNYFENANVLYIMPCLISTATPSYDEYRDTGIYYAKGTVYKYSRFIILRIS